MKIEGHVGNTDLKSLKIAIAKYYNKFGIVPKKEWLLNNFEINENKLNGYLSYLKKKRFLIDDGVNLTINPEKFTVKKKEDSNDNADHTKIQIDTNNSVSEKFIDVKNTFLEKPLNHYSIDVLKIILLIVGIGATYMSVYYSKMWLQTFLTPRRAFLLAVVMVSYAVSSFELIVLFKLKRRYILALIFSILWIVVSLFSMVSTVAGQYNGRMELITKENEAKEEVLKSNKQVREYQELKEKYETQLNYLRDDDRRIQNLLANYKTVEEINANKKVYDNLNWNRYQNNKDRQKFIQKLEELEKNKPEEIIKIQNMDFYSWVANIFGFGADKIQFWLSIFPAIFIDIIAPLSFAVVMFVRY